MKTYGYCRVSTKYQELARQIANITKEYPDAVIIEEKYTGTTSERPKWQHLINKDIKKGDTIIFDSVSRMSRNADEGMQDYERLYEMGVNLIFLKEPHINTSVYRNTLQTRISEVGNEIADEYIKATNRVLMILARNQVRIAFEMAQKEVDEKRKCVSEGIREVQKQNKKYQANGEFDKIVQIGQKKGRTLNIKKKEPIKKEILKKSKDFEGSYTDKDLMIILGIARNTYYKYKKEVAEEFTK